MSGLQLRGMLAARMRLEARQYGCAFPGPLTAHGPNGCLQTLTRTGWEASP